MNRGVNQQISRRNFVKLSSLVGIGFLGLHTSCKKEDELLVPKIAELQPAPIVLSTSSYGYGPLSPHPDGILELPHGFTYSIISRSGSVMNDGFFVPANPDGMATFQGNNGRTIIIRNHENDATATFGPFGKNNQLLDRIHRSKVYDFGKGVRPAVGGTTTVIFDENTMKVEKEYLSLVGTIRNCAGGATPWKSWISCEESVVKVGSSGGYAEKNHGYNFEVMARSNINLSVPLPLIDMGRFNHEAVAVDPRTSIVYQTEDLSDGLIYRFIPYVPGQLALGGKLQALAVLDKKSFDTRNWGSLSSEKFPIGQQMEVYWIDIEDVTSPDDTLRLQGFDKGAAKFARGEGMWFGHDELYFACTNGGNNEKGQVFKYIPSPYEGTVREKEIPGKIELFVEPNNSNIAQYCDNLTIAPWGDIILCEDNGIPRIVGITPSGEYYHIAKNIGHLSEFAGAVFSPSGKTLFVNIQKAGLTLAITGPWMNNQSLV